MDPPRPPPRWWFHTATHIWHKPEGKTSISYEHIIAWSRVYKRQPHKVWSIPILDYRTLKDWKQHPTQKPLRLLRYLIEDYTAGIVNRPLPATSQDQKADHKYTSADAARYGSMGGLLTTATDYARFLIAVMDPKPADAFRLKEASISEMLTPQVKVEDGPGYSISWALGWKVAKTVDFGVLVSHGGDQSGFHSLAEMSPSRKSGYVIMTNGENGWKLIQELAPEFARRVHATPPG